MHVREPEAVRRWWSFRLNVPEWLRLAVLGLVVGSAVGLAWRLAGRDRLGAVPFLLTALVAAGVAGRSDWPEWSGPVAVGLALAVLAAAGTIGLLARPDVSWQWVAAGSLVSAAGVGAGVPETGPVSLVGGGLAGLAFSVVATRGAWGPSAGAGAAALVAWAALSGAAGRPWAALGGALCTGVAPWFAIPWRALARFSLPSAPSRKPGPWLLAGHAVVVVAAARWIGVVPHAGWPRLAVVGAAGLALAATSPARA